VAHLTIGPTTRLLIDRAGRNSSLDACQEASSPPVRDRHDAGAVLRDVEEGGLGHVEVRARRVAPAAVVAGEAVVGRAEVGGRHGDGARQARPPGVVAAQLVAGPARRAVVEQRRTQRRRVRAVPAAVHVAVPASAACTCVVHQIKKKAARMVVG
jgi:hypothetical protein